MIGTDDQDIIDTFETLIDLVINTVSKNITGELDDIINSFESDASTLDKNKMKKTVGAFTKCLNENQDTIKNIKDKDGKPMGDDLMKFVETPSNNLPSSKNIDLTGYGKMMDRTMDQMRKLYIYANKMENMKK